MRDWDDLAASVFIWTLVLFVAAIAVVGVILMVRYAFT